MPKEMSAVWLVRHTFQAWGMKAVVVSVAAALPIQSEIVMRSNLSFLSAVIIALQHVCTAHEQLLWAGGGK